VIACKKEVWGMGCLKRSPIVVSEEMVGRAATPILQIGALNGKPVWLK
jgi:hypothetical protein